MPIPSQVTDAVRQALLIIHFKAGFVAIAASFAAAISKSIRLRHRIHQFSGRAFVLAMIGIVGTALPLALIGGDLFLVLVAILSGYLAFTGCEKPCGAVQPRHGQIAPLRY